MDGENGEPVLPKLEIVTTGGKSRINRGYTSQRFSTYPVGEGGTTESFGGEYVESISQGAGKTDNSLQRTRLPAQMALYRYRAQV